jgi:hypothetical protein
VWLINAPLTYQIHAVWFKIDWKWIRLTFFHMVPQIVVFLAVKLHHTWVFRDFLPFFDIFLPLKYPYNTVCHLTHIYRKIELIRSNELYWVYLSISSTHFAKTLPISSGEGGCIVMWHPVLSNLTYFLIKS